MTRSWVVTVVVVGVPGVAATLLFWPRLPAGVSPALDAAETSEVLSVDPEPADVGTATSPTDFHSHRILGRVAVTDPAARRRLAAALRGGVAWDDAFRCFNPRLGLRLVHAGHTTDLLVCFGCKQGYAWRDGEPVGGWVTDRSPKPAFDAALKAAGVPMAADDE